MWQGKKARCAFGGIVKHRSAGGIGHVHLQDYYFASILGQLNHWIDPTSRPLWKDLEGTQVQRGNLRDFLMTARLQGSLGRNLAPTILASLRAWSHLCTASGWTGPTLPLNLPITAVQNIIPDLKLTLWEEKGICYLEDMLTDSCMEEFGVVRQRFGLPDTEKFNYLRVSQWFKKSSKTLTFLPTKIAQFYQRPASESKGISVIYR